MRANCNYTVYTVPYVCISVGRGASPPSTAAEESGRSLLFGYCSIAVLQPLNSYCTVLYCTAVLCCTSNQTMLDRCGCRAPHPVTLPGCAGWIAILYHDYSITVGIRLWYRQIPSIVGQRNCIVLYCILFYCTALDCKQEKRWLNKYIIQPWVVAIIC